MPCHIAAPRFRGGRRYPTGFLPTVVEDPGRGYARARLDDDLAATARDLIDQLLKELRVVPRQRVINRVLYLIVRKPAGRILVHINTSEAAPFLCR